MNSQHVVLALRRQKAILEQLLDLSQRQLQLFRCGESGGFDMLLNLRGAHMTELAVAEADARFGMSELESGCTHDDLEEIFLLNNAISNLANRIADTDETSASLIDLAEESYLMMGRN